MNFSKALKELLRITDTKMKDLAEYLNYDLSYISKWSNDKLLPNQKVYIEVISKMSKFLARSAYLQGLQDEIAALTDRPFIVETSSQLRNLIYAILEYGYFNTECIKKELIGEKEERAYMCQSTKSIIDNLVRETKMAIYSSDEDIEIYCSSSDFFFIKEILSKFKSFYIVSNVRIVIKIMITEENMETLFHDSELRQEIYNLVSNLLFFDVEIYQDFVCPHSGFVYIEDQFIANYSVGMNGLPNSMLFTQKKSLVDEYHLICKKLFSKKNLIMSSKDKLEFEEVALNFYMAPGDSKVVIYSSFVEAIYMDNDFLEDLIEKHDVQGFEVNMLHWMKRAYNNMMENKELVINLTKRGLTNSISRKELIIGGIVYKLSAEEYKRYIDGFKNMLRNEKNIKVYLFEDRAFPINIYELGMTIYLSESYSYLKKNPKYVDDRINGYFELLDKTYSNKFFDLSEKFHNDEDFVQLKESDIDEYLNLLDWVEG